MRKFYLLLLMITVSISLTGQQTASIAEFAPQANYSVKPANDVQHAAVSLQELMALPKPNTFPAISTQSTKTVYLMQDFEAPFTGSPAAPPSWTQSRFVLLGTGTPGTNGVDGEKDWQQNTNTGASAWTFNGYSSTRPAGAVSGTGVAFLEDGYFGSTAIWFGSRRLESPSINLSTSTSPYVRFWLWYLAGSSNTNLRVMASSDGGTTWNSIMVIPPNATATTVSSATPWQRINVLIPPAYRTANAKFGIETTNTYGVNDIWIDDFSVEEFAPTTITSAASGNWSAAATWTGGVVPSADNHVIIAAGHTVNADVNIARMQNLTINGTLAYAGTSTTQLIHAFGDVTINSGGTLNAFSGTTGKRIYFGGSILNNGTMNFSVGAGNIVWVGGAPATLSGSGTITNGRASNLWHINSAGVTYNIPIAVSGTLGLYNGVVNPNGNLTVGVSSVSATQTIERTSRGGLLSQPIWGSGVNRSVSFITANLHPPSKQLFTTGNEIRQDAGVGYVEGTFTMSTHDNVELGYPVSVGTATLGTLTLTRGILIATDANMLSLSAFIAGPTGTAQTIAAAPNSHITNHGSYISGPLRINFPSTGTTTRNFPLGVGTGFAGTARNENNLKTISFASTGNWTGSTVKVSLVGPLSGPANAPLTQVLGTRGWYVDLLGGPDLPGTTTVSIRGRNNTGGNSDNLMGDLAELRVAQSPNLTGPWTARSIASGTGPILDNTEYIRTTAVTAPGPIAPIGTNGAYFGFATTQTAANPTGVTAVADGQNKIDINFTPNTANNPVIIVFNTTGTFTDPTGTPPAVGEAFAGGTLLYNGLTSPFSHTGLTPATTYYYRLFSYNEPLYSSGVSVNATTACPVFNAFPVAEGFEATLFPPACWTVAPVSGTGNWQGIASGTNPTTTPQQGSRMAYYNSYSFSSGTSSIMVSPAINFPNSDYRVNFWMNRDNGFLTNADRVIVHYNTSPNLVGATELGTVHRSINLAPAVTAGGWYNYIYNIPTSASGTGYIIFQAISAYGNNIFLDNVKIEQIPPLCTTPDAQPTALNLTATSASVNGTFTASPSANGYLVVRHTSSTLGGTPVNNTVYTPGAALGDGTVVYSGPLTEFSSASLASSTQYHFFVFAYNLSETCTGPIYQTASPLTGSVTTGPAAPASLTATPTSSISIALTATPNAQSHDIIVAWNTTNTFGTPTGVLTPGAQINGGGTVHYVGSASGLPPHTGLTPGTQYFYRAWSVVPGPVYSSTSVSAATSTFFGVPFVQNFDASPIGSVLPAGWTSHQSAAARPWTISNNTTIGNVSAPNFVGVFYHATLPKNEWMVTPGIQLTANQPYLIRFFVKAPGWAGIPERMKVTVASSNTLAAISAGTEIFNNPNMIIPTYQEQTISFTPATTGTYYFGWHAYSVADVDYIAIDNIRIEEQPAIQFTPESADFRDVFAGMQSVPTAFTIKNNRNTPITVTSVGFSGANADQFIKQDANTYPLTIPAGGTTSVNVIFKPTSPGQKNALLQVVENNGTWTVPLTGKGYLHSPQNLTATLVAPANVQLNWEAPIFPANEIRFDDNTAESWFWVADPSATSHMFSTRITIPQSGQLTHIAVLTRATSPTAWQNIMLCPDNAGNPNLTTPIESFANVQVNSTTGQWIILPLTTPLNVSAGQDYFIVTQWPAASSVGPFVGTDNSLSFNRSRWTNNNGTLWNSVGNNFMMRAYMTSATKGELVLKPGDENPAMMYLPVVATTERAKPEKPEIIVETGVEAPSILASGEATEGKNPTGYIVYRGNETGNYDTQFNVSGTSHLDNTTAGASTYFYAVAAVYPQGEGLSPEVSITTPCLTLPIPFVQNFPTSSMPPCWTQSFSGGITSNRWTTSNTSFAGGQPWEMKATYVTGTGTSRLITPALSTTGQTHLTLRFRHYYDDYGAGVTLKIQSSADGVTWTDEAWTLASGSGNVGPAMVTTTINNNIGNATYIAWVIDGNHFQFDYWYIDNVEVAPGMTVTPIPQHLTCYGANNGSIALTISGGVPPYTFSWSGPGGFTSTLQNLTALAAGTYTYTVTGATGISETGSVTLTQPNAVPAPEVSNVTVTYNAQPHTLTATAAPGTTLVWYDAAVGGNIIAPPSAINAGIYQAWVAGKDIDGCESSRIPATLTINKKALVVTAENKTVCHNQPLPTLTYTMDGFVIGEGPAHIGTLPVASTTAQIGSAPGNYPITLCCGQSTNYDFVYVAGTLTIVENLTVGVHVSLLSHEGCIGTPATFQASAMNGGQNPTYQWKVNGVNAGTNSPTFTYLPANGDIITVVLTSSFACTFNNPATSNPIIMNIALPVLELASLPAHGGLVSGAGSYTLGSQVTVSATPIGGWDFVSWKNKNGVVVSTTPTFEFTVSECHEMLTATFNSVAQVAGQLKYFNSNETVVPSPNANSVFYVQLFHNGQAVSDRQLVKFNFDKNLPSYFEFLGAESYKTYTLRVWEQPLNDILANSWMWNNAGGLSSTDALLLAYMVSGNGILTQLPWIAPIAVPNYSELFMKVADMNNSGDLTGLDGLFLQSRIVNDPAYKPLPGGKHEFQLATKRLSNHADKSYPQAPNLVFQPFGTYHAGSTATSVYYEAQLTGLLDGHNVYNIYFVSAGDLNASHIPNQTGKSVSAITYQGTMNTSKGEEVLIPVIADRNLYLGAAGLGIKYNKQLVEVIDAEGFDIKYIDKEAGEVRFSKVNPGGFTISAGQTIATLRIKVLSDIAEGTPYLELLPMTEFVAPNLNIHPVTLKTTFVSTGADGSSNLTASLQHAIFPNPFNNVATLEYTLPVDSKVKVVVYNSLGQEVTTLLEATQQAGVQKITLNSSQLNGSGSYFYRIVAEGAQRTYNVRGTFVMTK